MHLDHAALKEWMAGERKLAVETIIDTLRKLRRLERDGFTGDVFVKSPDHARAEVKRVRALMRTGVNGKRPAPDSTIRQSEVIWNRLAEYVASTDERFKGVYWELTPVRQGQPQTVSPEDAKRARQYRHADEITEKRRRALIYIEDELGWRRSEIARMETKDLRPDLGPTGRIRMSYPAKRGAPMWWPAPAGFFSPKGPVMAWLKVRPVDPDKPTALWTYKTRYRGVGARAYCIAGVASELFTAAKELGVQLSFIRYRRHDTIRLDEAGVHPRIIQKKRNHKKLDWTLHYMGDVTIDRALTDLVKHGAHGFKTVNRMLRKGKPVYQAKDRKPPTAMELIEDEVEHVQVGEDVGVTRPEPSTTTTPELHSN